MKPKHIAGGIALGVMLFVGGAMSIAGGGVARAQESGHQVIEMSAKKYEFAPTPHVKKGTHVELKVTATDHDHGVAIEVVADGAPANTPPGIVFDSPERCWKVKKGESVTIDFVANAAGTYTIKCCVDCGMGHRHMRGQIVVEE